MIISYLYDPDGIFEKNLRRCGVENLIHGPAKVDDREHAALQLARPLEELGLRVSDLAARIYHSDEKSKICRRFSRRYVATPILAIHPGSGSETKNWPIENWIELGNDMLWFGWVLRIAGHRFWRSRRDPARAPGRRCGKIGCQFRKKFAVAAYSLPCSKTRSFVGHDSGISHLAAAAGAKCILLFGPTDPDIWAPMNENAEVLRAVSGKLSDIGIIEVEAAVAAACRRHDACLKRTSGARFARRSGYSYELMRIGIST